MDLSTALLAAYIALHLPLCLYGLHRVWLTIGLLGRARPPAPAPLADCPLVAVQLPVFDERHVVARVIAAAAALDWPHDRLEIQVLDDSTDETTAIAAQACEALRAQGIAASVLHRDDRTGFKAGALAAGLAATRAELIAIFDADFVPPPDFLRRTVPHLLAGAGMVQARWGHLNEGASLLARLQAILLDGHFVVEQVARARLGCFFQFNGTAGLWSRRAIEAAGGWEHDTLTEDLDLSYRAQLAGARFVYLDELVAPAELPADLAAFKAQQHRWGKGMAQALRKAGGRIVGSRASVGQKIEALLHLSSVTAWPVVLVVSAVLPLSLAARHQGWLAVPAWVDLAIFACASLTIALFFAVAAVRADRDGLGVRLALIPVAMLLGLGLSLAQTSAVLAGLFGPTGEFERTPKAGTARASSYRARWRPVVLAEILMGAWLLGAAAVAAWVGFYGAIPFLVLLGAGFFLVGAVGLRARFHRQISQPVATSAGSQVADHSQAGSSQEPLSAS